jgi:FeS assembly SUF system protein
LVALLIRVLDGETPDVVATADLSFLDQIGMNEHLSPTRKNGLNAMVERIRAYARAVSESGQLPDPEDPESKSGTTAEFDEGVLRENVIDAMKLVYDPEIPVNVFDLGLIYDVLIYPDRSVKIIMTLTTPNCPAAGILPNQVETRVANVDGVSEARVELTFDPPYTPDRMSEAAKLELGFL